ncbi:endo-1,4-beta-xylanase [Lachnospiraceae bacterium MD1]|uniref:Beta-xylanase n=1 Tax=Variimorphobacter saccharofermentans TaxID=2755051 RepID=A0A839JX99_9FIRM|nr:endo-1,4-beta-xylanase [Variimorphobacter saccharofermentans]MBB2181858.1 endo-1,4-beta-xylanase [Variimorphobacter saccharofermentans]
MSSSLAHRKAVKKIRFIDIEGNALSNTLVHVKLVNHQFLFGCGSFDSLPATSEADMGQSNVNHDMKMPEKSFFEDRVNKWLEVFNFGTLPFYWGRFEPKEGEILTDSRMRAAKMLQKNHVKVKGHPLCWHTACADWLMDYDNATILQKQLDRIYRDVTAFRGVIDIWDVINEVVIMPVYDRYDNAITRICKELGRVRLVKEVFDAAKSANPDATLLINDFNLSESYRILIDGCLNAGVPITSIGIQTHQHQGYMGREKLEDILERFSVFGLPLHFTENTLISGDLMPKDIVDLNDYQVDEWPSTPEGEERQKKEWSEMYHILFEHPLVEAVTGWDFADGAWLGAPSGLIRKDNTIKPVYHELKRLIHEEWNTEGDLRTDENGNVILNGFKGEYEITLKGRMVNFTLDGNGDSKDDVIEITV